MAEDERHKIQDQHLKAQTIGILVDADYDRDSVVQAVEQDDFTLLKPT